jgi:hypothetical protein
VKILLTLLTLAVIGLVTYALVALVRSHPAIGIPLAVVLVVWGLIRAYNAMLQRAEEAYRRRRR